MSSAVTLARSPITAVWLGLVLATLASWWLGTDHGFGGERAATVAVLVIAFAKVRFVGLYFMELRHAPAPLRAAMELYSVVICAALIGIYLVA